jgi:hypothetical protein
MHSAGGVASSKAGPIFARIAQSGQVNVSDADVGQRLRQALL